MRSCLTSSFYGVLDADDRYHRRGYFYFCHVLQLLLAKDLETVLALSSVSSGASGSNDHAPLATALLQIFRHERQEAHLLKTLNDIDIDNEG